MIVRSRLLFNVSTHKQCCKWCHFVHCGCVCVCVRESMCQNDIIQNRHWIKSWIQPPILPRSECKCGCLHIWNCMCRKPLHCCRMLFAYVTRFKSIKLIKPLWECKCYVHYCTTPYAISRGPRNLVAKHKTKYLNNIQIANNLLSYISRIQLALYLRVKLHFGNFFGKKKHKHNQWFKELCCHVNNNFE